MKVTSSSGILKAICHNDSSYLLLFGNGKLQSLEISCELFLLLRNLSTSLPLNVSKLNKCRGCLLEEIWYDYFLLKEKEGVGEVIRSAARV